jgi:hypothetical protein
LPLQGEQTLKDLSVAKAVYLEDQTMAFRLENEGTVEKPVLLYTLFAHESITEDMESELLDRIKFFEFGRRFKTILYSWDER